MHGNTLKLVKPPRIHILKPHINTGLRCLAKKMSKKSKKLKKVVDNLSHW